MNRILLIRHCATNAIGHRLSGRAPGVELNATGRAQAMQLADRLGGIPLDAIYTSPLERARQTALPLARDRGLEALVLPQLQELDYGLWQGARLEDLAGDPYWEVYNRSRGLYRIPGGETLAEAQIRMLQAVEWLRAEHAQATLALVSHCDPIRALLAHLLGMPLDFIDRLDVMPASISLVEFANGRPKVRCINTLGNLPCLRS
ncbi:MAG: histidine phosphatase family protein [Aquisalimonadaceae bacterium]